MRIPGGTNMPLRIYPWIIIVDVKEANNQCNTKHTHTCFFTHSFHLPCLERLVKSLKMLSN